MLRSTLLFWAGFLLFVVGCADVDSVDPTVVPWAAAGFIDPVITNITFVNEGSESRNLDVDLRHYRDNLDIIAPDSLAPGDSFTVYVELHHPRYLFYRSAGHQSLRPLLPGRHRILIHRDSAVVESGPYALEYDYLDRVLMPLNPVGRQPSELTDLMAYKSEAYRASHLHLDTTPTPIDLPSYVPAFLATALEAGAYQEALSLRGYYMYFQADTLPLTQAFEDSLTTFLAQNDYTQTFLYKELFEGLARFWGESSQDNDLAISSNNAAATTSAYIKNYPDPDHYNDAVANRLAYLITDDRVYLGKEEYIERLRITLPTVYQKKLAEIQRADIAKKITNNGLSDLLNTPLLLADGTKQQPALLGNKPLRLLKFWFAGCYPCLVQQPYEVKLLADHSEVDLLYIAHNTKPDDWQDYLLKHQPPAAYQLYVPLSKRSMIQRAAGTTGAPTYVMVDAQGETICRPCPKPSDPLLGTMIKEALAEK